VKPPPPKSRFKLNAKLFLLDATVINLSLKVFPWATYQQKKGAIKLHVGLSADGYLPEFFDMTTGKEHEINWARALKLPAGSFVIFDRGYTLHLVPDPRGGGHFFRSKAQRQCFRRVLQETA